MCLTTCVRTLKMSWDFSAVVGTEDILKLIIGNEGLHKIGNDNVLAFRTSNFVKSKVKLWSEQHSHITAFINALGILLMWKHTQADKSQYLYVTRVWSFRRFACDTDHYMIFEQVWETKETVVFWVAVLCSLLLGVTTQKTTI